MCGIAGLISRAEKANTHELVDQLLKPLSLRGPDGQGTWVHRSSLEGSVGLGHRRLSIIDLEGGKQPLRAAQGRYTISFNGEIFNFQELKPQIKASGGQFLTQSYTEVIVALYAQLGIESLAPLNGMFAFAIYDEAEHSLLLARDRVGIKPLYYYHSPAGDLFFSSDIRSFIESGVVEKKINLASVANYLFSEYAPEGETFIEGVKKVKPGCYLKWQDGKLTEQIAYWSLQHQLSLPQVESITDFDQAYTEFCGLLNTSIRRQMIADVPIGLLLSGGLDSTTVGHAMVEQGHQVKSFSIEFEDPDFDEGPVAKKVSEYLKTQHHSLKVGEQDLLEALEASLASLSEPMADPSIIPTYILSQLTKSHVKVAIGGDAGDELFGGYPTYYAHSVAQKYSLMPQALHRNLVVPLIEALPTSSARWSLEWKLKRFFGRFDYNEVHRHLRWMAGTDLPRVKEICGLESHWQPDAFAATEFLKNTRSQFVFPWLDFVTYLPSEVLVKVDRASMASSLEVRPPFLDNEFIDFSIRLAPQLKVQGKNSKPLIRRYVGEKVGDWVSRLPKKGFGIPLNKWLRGALRERVEAMVNDQTFFKSVGLNQPVVRELWQEHLDGRADHARTLWALFVMYDWLIRQKFI